MRKAETDDIATLVSASAAGDEDAWNELVRRFAGLVLKIIRLYRLSPTDTQDVAQTVWLRLVEHIGRVRDPAALPGWLGTTTHHECQHFGRHSSRSTATDPLDISQLVPSDGEPIDHDLVAAERYEVLRKGLAELTPHHRELLTLLASDPPTKYEEISRILNIAPGSIGPTRGRALKSLRETNAVQTCTRRTGMTTTIC